MSMEHWRNEEVGISKYSREQPVPGTIPPPPHHKKLAWCARRWDQDFEMTDR